MMAEVKSLVSGEAGCMRRKIKRGSKNIFFKQKTKRSKLLLRGLTRYNFLPHPRECKRKIKKELR